MIKFFRNIRKNLLNEGKTSKYFKYAIGEIVLVVIGILIALQINNWNENRKLENSKHKLLLALKNELVNNKNELEIYFHNLNISNSKFNKVLRYSVGDYTIPTDSLKYYLSEMLYYRTLSIFSSVQDEAISSGKFELLSDSLKQNLSLLKDYTHSRNSIRDQGFNIFFERDNQTTKVTTSLYMSPEVPDELASHSKIPTHPEFLLTDMELSTLVKNPETYLTLNKIYLTYASDEVWVKHGLISVTNKTIALIDKELNTHD
ncbi:DUF6090 family protein [Hanstruepera marina]|uniref:DUF6090 family protein n=1 Tax=Hanstruepera marina TaxID=2873265 RepID=UPI001CA5FED2|nr:DUF6090 family protein [Hanstruepera marina]